MSITAENTPSVVATEAAVRLSGLRKHFGGVRAVDGLDLVIEAGEVVALLGPNGAGKSTAVDMMLGLSAPDAGSVRVFGEAPRAAVRSGRVGAMLQAGALRGQATVAETVGCVAALHGRGRQTARVLERAGVADLAGQRCGKLSGGQRQRVRFALAVVSEPDLIVLDEPTVAMDVQIRRAFWESMRAFTDAGRTVLFATHYLEEAEEFADRVVFLRHGRVVADGTVAEIRAAVSGRVLRARVPGAAEAALRALPGVRTLELRGEHLTVHSGDSDATLRALLGRFPEAADVEITATGLEDAFLALTADDGEDGRR